MSNETSATTTLVANHGDAIRIVPLYDASAGSTPTVEAAQLAPPVAPKLTYRGGPQLFRMHRRTQYDRCPDVDQFPRTLRGDHRCDPRSRLV